MEPIDVIKALQADNSRLAKKQIIRDAWNSGNTNFFEGMKLAYDCLVTFGVRKLPKSTSTLTMGYSYKDFFRLAVKLWRRELTGHAARDAIREFCDGCTKEEWDLWYSKILLKDLRCGVSEVTVNEVLREFPEDESGEFLIPVFSCQLAQDSEGGTNPEKLSKTKIVYCEAKYDGTRLLFFYDKKNDEVICRTRNGKENHNFGPIQEELHKALKKFDRDVVIDGEVISKNFQAIMKQVNRKKDVDTSDAIYCVFDIIDLEAFATGYWGECLINRKNLLDGFFEILGPSTRIQEVEYSTFDLSLEKDRLGFEEYKKAAVEAGLEGIIIKDPLAGYECKRSGNWLKYKPSFSYDLTIVGFEEGTGKHKGRLGALVCEGSDKDKFIRVNVGSGYTDIQRDEFWCNKGKLIGQMVEIECDSITKAQNGDSYSLRFPRFLRFRDDKS